MLYTRSTRQNIPIPNVSRQNNAANFKNSPVSVFCLLFFISIDSRLSNHNPLYKAWKTKSFTDGDITLHFILFDILFDPSIEMSFSEITDQIDERLSRFSELRMFAESTVRKRL